MDKTPCRQSIEITIKRWKVTLGTQNSLQRLFASFFLRVMQVFSHQGWWPTKCKKHVSKAIELDLNTNAIEKRLTQFKIKI
jgi:hypothetical protein